MDSDMMRHWGGHRRDVYRPYGEDELVQEEDPEQPRRETLVGLQLMAINEEECSQDTQSIQASQDGSRVTKSGQEEEEEQEDNNRNNMNGNKAKEADDNDDNDDQASDHDEEGPHNDFQSSSPLHTAFGLQAEDLMLNNTMAADTAAKYRTVSVFGGVFGLPEDPVDSDNCSLSSASDGFSSDEDYNAPPPKRSPKRKAAPQPRNLPQTAAATTSSTPPPKVTMAPRVVSPPTNEETNETSESSPVTIRDPPALVARSKSVAAAATNDADDETEKKMSSSSSIPQSPSSSSKEATAAAPETPTASPTKSLRSQKSSPGDSSMTRALKAFDQTENLLTKVLGELEAAPFYAVAPQVMEDAITSLQVSKQTLESALCLEDSVLSC